MKNDDFLGGDRICTPVLSDTIDNVVFAAPYWVSGQAYQKGDDVTHLGIQYMAVVPTSGAVAPAASADWTRDQVPPAKVLASLIWCDGAGGTVKFTTYNGDVDTLTVATGTLLAMGALRVRRVWATGTTATLLRAIAEG